MVTVASHPAGGPAWIELMTSIDQFPTAVYADLFDWMYESWPREDSDYLVCMLHGLAVAGMDQPAGLQRNVPSGWLIYFASENIEEKSELASALGARILVPPTELPRAGEYAILRDPAGSAFGLWEARGHIGAQIVREPGALCWAELATPNVEESLFFYSSLLACDSRPSKLTPGDAGVLLAGGHPVATIRRTSIDKPVIARWIPFLGVTSMLDAVRVLDTRGREQNVETLVGRGVVIRDPHGYELGLLEYGNAAP